MKIRELFQTDPTARNIPNDGVAEVKRPTTDQEWEVVRYELESFVCEGQYQKGLERILGSYLENLAQPTQPAVWISGFYGSGKSHLVRILEFLWTDRRLPDGASARDITHVSTDVLDYLKELSREGIRHGGLWTATGSLARRQFTNPRLALLSIIFTSAGLPERYAFARFDLWLQKKGYKAAVIQHLSDAGTTYDDELQDLYFSDSMGEALLSVQPSLGNIDRVQELLLEQFPHEVPDVTDEEMIEAIEAVLDMKTEKPGKWPLTLIVLDELEQFLGDNTDRTLQVMHMVETCRSRFGSHVLFVATGQSALSKTTLLSKLVDRFKIQVQLSDTDVETVVRRVLLRKNPQHTSAIRQMLDTHSGEIDRHLGGTKAAPQSADSHTLVEDYPLLPSRRRFWNYLLKAVHGLSVSSQARTQLRIVHQALCDVAGENLGRVIPADTIYDQLSSVLQQNEALLSEIHPMIEEQAGNQDNGALRCRICKTVFLLNRISGTGGTSGLSATADFIADLLVDDLTQPSETLRTKVNRLLEDMTNAGTLQNIDGEYRLQTPESAQWVNHYEETLRSVKSDEIKVAEARGQVIKAAIEAALKGLGLTQGDSKTPRKWILDFGPNMPGTEAGQVPVWIRDEWSVDGNTVLADARDAGQENAVIHVFLSKTKANALKDALCRCLSAQTTLDAQGIPVSQDGIYASKDMESRREAAKKQIKSIIDDVLADAKVYLGGGSLVESIGFRACIEIAARSAIVRLFPYFQQADFLQWDSVCRLATDGNGAPLKAIGFQEDTEKHPVCKAILEFLGGATRKGLDIRKHFEDPPYGWPKDAVHGATISLVASGHLIASQAREPLTARQLDRTRFGGIDFRAQIVVITTSQKLAIRRILKDADIKFINDQEAAAIPSYLRLLRDITNMAGGSPPLPEKPAPPYLAELEGRNGNELILGVLEHKDDIAADSKRWDELAKRRKEREPKWDILQRLLKHAEGLPAAEEVRPQADAVYQNRSLLDDVDPAPPLIDILTNALRAELNARFQDFQSALDTALGNLHASPDWLRLDQTLQKQVITVSDLVPVPTPDVSTTESILKALTARNLEGWVNLKDAVSGRLSKAYDEMTRLLEPTAQPVEVRKATLKTPEDVESFINELRTEVLNALKEGPVRLV